MSTSLNIDLFFFAALTDSTEVRDIVGDRIFHTYRNNAAEKQDKIPYIIITSDEASSDPEDKDSVMARLDRGTVSVLCVAKDPQALAQLTDTVCRTIDDAAEGSDIYDEHEEWDFHIEDIQTRAEGIEADPDKPCLFRWMHFICQV